MNKLNLKDFKIATRLVKDAIESRDVDFRTTKTCLQYKYIKLFGDFYCLVLTMESYKVFKNTLK